MFIDPDAYSQVIFWYFALNMYVCVVSFLTLMVYFIKKIFLRGAVDFVTVYTSFRQSILLGIFGGCLYGFYKFSVITYSTLFLLLCVIICMELLLRVMESHS